MKIPALLLSLAFSLAAGVGAQLVPIAQPIKVARLPPCNQRQQNLSYMVVDATNAAQCTGGGSTISICSCDGGVWSLMSGIGSTSDHGMLTGLADDDHTQYFKLTGRTGQQIAYGGVASTDALFISANAADAQDEALVFMLGSQGTGAQEIGIATDYGTNQGTELRMTNGMARLNLGTGDYFQVGGAATSALRVEAAGNVGLDGRLRIGDSDSDANSTCLSVSSDHLFGDLDCDGTKDTGEYLLDGDVAKYLPLDATSSIAVAHTGAATDLTFSAGRSMSLTAATGTLSLLSTIGGVTVEGGGNVGLTAGASVYAHPTTTFIVDVAAGADELTITPGKLAYIGYTSQTPQAETCADDAAGTKAVLTLLPIRDVVEITSADAQGCDVTMSETGMTSGRTVKIKVVAVTAGAVNFADTSGITELAGAFAMGLYDSLSLDYAASRWIESGRSNN